MKKSVEHTNRKAFEEVGKSRHEWESILSSKDVFSYFRRITPEEYEAYGIDKDDIPFGTFAALKHPESLKSHLGGNAYGSGLFEHRALSDEELRILESFDPSDPESLKKHFLTINELYRKMGLLIRLSRKGIFYYLIPLSFITHFMTDIRIRVNLIQSLIPEISKKKDLKIGIMTSSDDILTHELIARFPQHRFLILSSLEDLSAKRKPFDVFICPHHPAEYLKNLLNECPIFPPIAGEKLTRYTGYLFMRLRRTLSSTGIFAIVCSLDTQKTYSQLSMKNMFETFFAEEVRNEILPEEYRNEERHRAPFLCIRAYPKSAKTLKVDIEEFLKKTPLAGCPVNLVADYKNTLDYIANVLGYLTKLSESEKTEVIKRSPKIKHIISRYKKLIKIQSIFDPSEVKKEPVKFFSFIPELSLLGFTRSELQEMGLIVTGHSSLGRVIMGKYPVHTLEPLRKFVKQQPSYIDYLSMMTMAELATSLKRDLSDIEKKQLDQITVAFSNDEKFQEILEPLQTIGNLDELLQMSYKRVRRLTMSDVAESNEDSTTSPTLEKHLLNIFHVDQEFLGTFLRAKLHGTGHILPLLGFYPSLILLWASVFFGKTISEKSCSNPASRSDLVINLNPIFQGVPLEHRRDLAEKLRHHIYLAVNEYSAPPFGDIIHPRKTWFWLKARLQFTMEPGSNTVNVGYFDLEESTKVVESFSKHLEARSARNVPSIIVREANHHTGKILQYVETTTSINSELNPPLTNSTIIALWKSLFEKLLSPEEAYETLLIIGKKAPILLSIVVTVVNEESFDAIAKAFRRLRSITERHKSGFQEANLFYAMAKKEFGPYAEEKIGISPGQFQEMEGMLSYAHADFSIYQAMIIALTIHHLPHQEVSKGIDRILTNMLKANLILDYQAKMIKKHALNLLKGKEIISSICNGTIPLIHLGELTSSHNSRSFLEATFLLSITLESGIMTSDMLAQMLKLRHEVLDALKKNTPWRIHLEDIIARAGSSFNANSEIMELDLENDVHAYGHLLRSIEKPTAEPSPELIKGRYITALDRILRFHNLSPIQFRDVIELKKGTSFIELYHRKALSSKGIETFQELLNKAHKICKDIFSLPTQERITLLLSFDELAKNST
jgi:hypothetical protein